MNCAIIVGVSSESVKSREMASSSKKLDYIVKLDGSNFKLWKFQLTLVLKAHKLWNVVSGVETRPAADADKQDAWDLKDVEAQSIIASSVNAVQMNHIYDCQSAKGMFNKLVLANSDSSSLNKQHTLTRFMNYTIEKDESPVAAMIEIEGLARSLEEIGLKQAEETVVTKIVSCLPKQYAAFQTAWDSVDSKQQTLVNLQSRLKKEEFRMKANAVEDIADEEVGQTMAFRFNGTKTSEKKFVKKDSSDQRERKPKVKCFNCGKIGHMKRDCRSGKSHGNDQDHKHKSTDPSRGYSLRVENAENSSRNGQTAKTQAVERNAVGICGTDKRSVSGQSTAGRNKVSSIAYSGRVENSVCYKNDWISDSGASHHVCGSMEWFSSYEKFDESQGPSISLADNVTVKPLGKGIVTLEVYIGKAWIERCLLEVYYLPGGANLFSEVVMANQKGYTIVRKKFITWFKKPGEIGPIAEFKNNCYVMKFRPIQKVFHANVSKFLPKNKCAKLWHRRCGHINCRYVLNTVQKGAVRGVSEEEVKGTFDCGDCQVGKMPRKPFPRITSEVNAKVGERVYIDLAGKMPVESLEGEQYFMLLKDHTTGFRSAFFLKTKDEATGFIKEYVWFIENQTGNTVKFVVTDNGTEFVNRSVKIFFKEHGISHETPAPYCPESNGKIERDNRTIKDCARTILLASGLPEMLWAEAVRATVYIHNRILNKQSGDITAVESVFKSRPTISHFRVFGCVAYAHIFKGKRTVWKAKSERCIMVGYSTRNRKYRLYNETKGKVFEARNVNFFEEEPEVVPIPRKEITSCDNALKPSTPAPQVAESPRRKIIPDVIVSDSDDDADEDEKFKTPTSAPMNVTSPTPNATAGPSTQGPRMQEIIIQTPHGQYTAQVPEGEETVVTIPKKGSDYFVPKILPNRLRSANNAAPVKLFAARLFVEPASYVKALSSPESSHWISAMEEEIASQEANESWEVVDRPSGVRLLDTKWVYKFKLNDDGTINRYKARLVIRGYLQEEGVDYFQTFASVIRYESIRLLLNIAASQKYYIEQFDVKTAFLHGELKEEIYVKVPKGYSVNGNDKVLKLRKSIYGLKQSPRCWNDKLTECLNELGLHAAKNEPCVFIGKMGGHTVIVAIYVDDGLIMSSATECVQRLRESIAKKFEITSGKPTTYVGLEINRSGDTGPIRISQKRYVQNLLTKFNMQDCNPASVPLQRYTDLVPTDIIDDQFPFRQLIGSLIFLAKCSRPDISFAVSKLAQYMSGFNESHWKAAKHVLRYLKGTMDMGITYFPSEDITLIGYTDADYAGDKISRKSTTGTVFLVNGKPVSWCSQKQPCVSLSSTESEYMAVSSGGREAVWLRSLLKELNFPQLCATPILVDNQSAIRLVENPEMHSRTKHIDVRHHYIRELQDNGEVSVEYVHTSEQLADGLTKPLLKGKLEDNRDALGLSSTDPARKSKKMARCQLTTNSTPTFRLALLSITILSCFSISAASMSQHASPIVLWRKSDTPVTTGHLQINLEVLLVNPCDLIVNGTTHHDLEEEARSRCQDAYHSVFMNELQEMCPKKHWSQLVVRKKRFVGIILGLVAIITVLSIGIGTYATAVATSNSNRIYSIEDRLNEVSRLFNGMEGQVKRNHEAIGNLTERFNQVISNLTKLQADHDELKGKTLSTSFAISYIVSQIMIGRTVVQKAARLWKQGKVSGALLDYFTLTLPCGDSCPIDLARAQKCGVSEDGTKLYLEFAATIISTDLTLVEADAFDLMVRKGNKTCTVRYTGPKNVILSESAQCVYAINAKPSFKSDLILATSRGCMSKLDKSNDTKHFSVDHCDRSYPNDELNFIQTKPYNEQYSVYCPESNLTVDGQRRKCPTDVLVLPMKSNFTINDLEFSGSRLTIVQQETLDPVFTLKTNWHLQPGVNWTSLMIDMNHTEEFHELYMPEYRYHDVTNYWSTIGCVAVIVMLVIILFCLIKKKNKPLQVSVLARPTNSEVIQMNTIAK